MSNEPKRPYYRSRGGERRERKRKQTDKNVFEMVAVASGLAEQFGTALIVNNDGTETKTKKR